MTGIQSRTVKRVAEIRQFLALGWTQKKIAENMGLSNSAISALIAEHVRDLPPLSPAEESLLLDRWLNVHDIGAMGERAVKETA